MAYIAALLVSCGGGEPIISYGDAIRVEITTPQTVNVADITDSVELIVLDTSPERALMAQVDKLRVYRDKIYCMDTRTNGIFIFETSGKFIRSIKDLGRGPNDYLGLINFELDYVNGEMIVGDRVGQKLLFYDLNGNFKRVQHIEWPIEEFAAMPNGNIIRGGSFRSKIFAWDDKQYDPHLISIYDPTGRNVLGEYLESEIQVDYLVDLSNYLVPDFSDNVTFGSQGDDIIYSVSSESCNPKYFFDWNDIPHFEPADYGEYDSGIAFLGGAKTTGNAFFLGEHLESPDYLHLTLGFGEFLFVLYSKKNNESRTLKFDGLTFREAGHFDEYGNCWHIMNDMMFIRDRSSDKAFVKMCEEKGIVEGNIVLCKMRFDI